MEVTRELVENIVEVKYDDLPIEVVNMTKRQILDILGVMFPPTTLERAAAQV